MPRLCLHHRFGMLLAALALAGCQGTGAAPAATAGGLHEADPATLVAATEDFLAKLQLGNRPVGVAPANFLPQPSNDRDWLPELKTLAYSEIAGDQVTVHNVRNAEFLTYRDCIVDYYDKTYDLNKLESVDFIVVPFADNPAIAHTMLSFGFGEGEYVGVSAEVRLEKVARRDLEIGRLQRPARQC